MPAATDLERLVVQLSADVRGYQKSLDRARGQTNKAARDIERRFDRMQKNISGKLSSIGKNFFAGFGAGALGAISFTGISSAVAGVVKNFADLADQAERAGVSTTTLQELQFIGRQAGVELEGMVGALKKLNVEVGKAQRDQKGNLFELFDANDVKFSDDVIENLATVADLVRNARTEQEKTLIAVTALGKSGAELLTILNQGGDAIRAQRDEVHALGGVLDEELIQAARDFDDAWTATIDLWYAKFARAILNTGVALKDVFDPPDTVGELEAAIKRVEKQLRESAGKTGELGIRLDQVYAAQLEKLKAQLETAKQQQGLTPEQIEAQEKVRILEEQILNIEKQIAVLREIGGGSSPRLIQLEKELEVLKQQLSVLQQINLTANQFSQENAFRRAVREGAPGPTIVPSKTGNDSESIAKAIEKGILAVISKVESGSNPNAVNFKDTLGLSGNINLLTMTVREVLALQAKMRADQRRVRPGELPSSALGEFQIVGRTLEDFVKKLGISLDEKFGPELQEKIAAAIVAAEVKKAQGDPQKLVTGLRGQFEGLKGLSDEQILQAVANSTTEIVKGNEALEKRAELINKLNQDHQIQVDQYKLEQAAIGATTEEVARQRAEWELIRQAREQGFDPANDEALMARIKAIAAEQGKLAQEVKNTQDAYDASQKAAEESLKAQEEAAQKIADTSRQIADAFGGALQGFISDLANGKKLTDALRDALLRLGESLLQIALNSLTSSIGGGAGGGALGGLGGILGSLFHDGGVVGAGGRGRLVSPSVFRNAKRYHGGGLPGLQPGEIPSILKKGEIVFPDFDALMGVMRRGSGGGFGRGLVQNNTFIAPDWKTSLRSQNQMARSAGAELERVRRTL